MTGEVRGVMMKVRIHGDRRRGKDTQGRNRSWRNKERGEEEKFN